MRLEVDNMPACRGSRGAVVVRRILLEKVAGDRDSRGEIVAAWRRVEEGRLGETEEGRLAL